MVKITKKQFLEMFSLGVFKGNLYKQKDWTVTCRNKPSKQKTRYVDEEHYAEYLKKKNIYPS